MSAQLSLFRERVSFDGDGGTLLYRIPGTAMAVVLFDGERELGTKNGSYAGRELLVDVCDLDSDQNGGDPHG